MVSLTDLESAIKRLESSVDSLGFWLEFWTAIVVIGLIVEYSHDFFELLWTRRLNRARLRELIGGTLITAGVAGELFVGMVLSAREAELRGVNDKVVALLNKETAEARKAASVAEQKAAEANEKAEQERLARVKIEQRLADRVLSDEQALRIASKLRPFAGQEYKVTTYEDLREPLAFANRIHQCLQTGRWKYLAPTGWTTLAPGIGGVHIFVHPQADERTKQAADVLVSALVAEGVEAVKEEKNAPDNPDSIIQVNVGTKQQ